MKTKILFFTLIVFVFASTNIYAATDRVFLGQTIRIGDFVFEDDYTPSTDDCTISIYDPSGVQKVNEATMIDNVSGWHYYDYAVGINEEAGKWPVIMSCGSNLNLDLVKVNKDFIAEVDTTLSTSTIASSVATSVWSNPLRTLTDYATSSIAVAVWGSTNRTLTSFGTLVSDIWSNGTRSLTDYGASTIATAVWSSPTRDLTNYGNNISAVDVWNAANRTLTDYATSSIASAAANMVWSASNKTLTDYATSSIVSAIWSNPARTLTNYGNDITAADVWAATNRSLTDYATSSIAAGVWLSPTRALTNYGNNLSAADVWNAANRSLTDYATSSIATAAANLVWSATNRSLTDYATTSIAAGVWLASNRSLTDYGSVTATATADMVWNRASSQLNTIGSIGKLLTDNIDAQISTRGTSSLTALDVWNAGTRSLTDYSESSVASAAAASVWANGTRQLTSYGNDITANDVWSVLTSNLTTINSIGKLLADNVDAQASTRATLSNQQAGWTVNMSDFATVQTGKTYRAKVSILNNQSIQTNPLSTPTVSLYDPSRNLVVSNISMTNISAGVYEYTYTVGGAAEQGVWEAVVNTEVESGKIITTNDYWLVAGSPAQVIINGVTSTGSNVTANLTVTNEGLTGYEYQYEWCVVSDINNSCGGGDDTYRGTGAKFINPGEDWNTNLTATVPTDGNYYFKVIVYFGTEKSGSSRTFTVTGAGTVTPPTTSGGGGGGGSAAGGYVAVCTGADLNGDQKVNTVDFSILLSFWKTKPPFKNTCVDINKDGNVNTVDFSILLSQWGTKGKALK